MPSRLHVRTRFLPASVNPAPVSGDDGKRIGNGVADLTDRPAQTNLAVGGRDDAQENAELLRRRPPGGAVLHRRRQGAVVAFTLEDAQVEPVGRLGIESEKPAGHAPGAGTRKIDMAVGAPAQKRDFRGGNLEEFNALSPEDKTAVLDAAARAQEAGWAASRQADLAKKTLMEEHGIQIVTPSPELEQAMRAAAREVIANWMITLPDDEKAVLVEFSQ